MKRYATTAEATPQQTTPTVADSLSGLLGATIALAVCGGVALAAGWIEVSGLRVVGLLAAVAWGGAFVMLVAASWGRAWCVLESATGRDLDRSGEIGDPNERVRLVPVRGGQLIDGVDVRDLAFFVRRIHATKRWSQREWRGVDMPSGRSCDNDYWAALCAPLRKAGILAEVTPGGRGTLTTQSAEDALERLGITEPN